MSRGHFWMYPKVTIIWVNFNSFEFIDLTLESLEAVENLDYPNYELIMVDNGSNDGSYELLRGFLEKSRINFKIIRLERNFGFTGGSNAGYSSRSKESKYVVLLNNDAVPRKESLTDLVDLIEVDDRLGAVQGVILNYDEKSIDTAGDYLSELLEATSLFQGLPPNSLKKPVFATSPDAAYSILRVKAIQKLSNQRDQLFENYLFGHLDDHILGLKLWCNSFRVQVFPNIMAKHNRGKSFKRVGFLQTYLGIRNLLILNEISNSRYKNLVKFLCFRRLSEIPLRRVFSSRDANAMSTLSAVAKGFLDGVGIGRSRRCIGERIDIYKAPILKVSPMEAFIMTAVSPSFSYQRLERELCKIAAC
jgi:GT2 family glycosyltransferase